MVDSIVPREALSKSVERITATAPRPAPDMLWHPDMGLPATVKIAPDRIEPLLDALGRWAWEIGGGGLASLGLWRGEAILGDRPGSLIAEAGRRLDSRPADRTVPDDDALARVRAAAEAAGALPPTTATDGPTDRVSVVLENVVDTALTADRPFGDAFSRRRLLLLRRPLLSPARLTRSLGLTGLETEFEDDLDTALALVDARAAEGRPFEFVALSAAMTGERLENVLTALRERPGGRLARLIVTGLDPDQPVPPQADKVLIAGGGTQRVLDTIFDLIRQPGPAASGTAAPTVEAAPSLLGRHVLVVEDVAMNRMLIEAMLAPTGATLALVGDGEAAIEAMRQRPADIVLMDIQLPRLDGVQATQRIREFVPNAIVIALTAHARETDRTGLLAAGMDDYLVKPIRVDDLYAAIRRALG